MNSILNSMIKWGIIIGIFVVATGVYLVYTKSITPKPLSEIIPVVSPTKSVEVQGDLATTDKLKQGGSSYMDKGGVYSFLYPSDYLLDQQPDGLHTRISKKGATQKGQTEMYDGVIMVFDSIDRNGKTLDAWVDDSIKQLTEDGSVSVVTPKEPVKVGSYSGYMYATRGLGEANYYVIQKDSGSKNAVLVTTLVADPEKMGYQMEVNSIMSSIQILK